MGQASGLSIWRIFAEMMLATAELAGNASSENADNLLRWAALLRQNGTGFEVPSTTVLTCHALIAQDNPEAALKVCEIAELFSIENNIGLMLPELLKTKSQILAKLGRVQEALSADQEAISVSMLQGISHPDFCLKNLP